MRHYAGPVAYFTRSFQCSLPYLLADPSRLPTTERFGLPKVPTEYLSRLYALSSSVPASLTAGALVHRWLVAGATLSSALSVPLRDFLPPNAEACLKYLLGDQGHNDPGVNLF